MNKVVKREELQAISLRKGFLNSLQFKLQVYTYTIIILKQLVHYTEETLTHVLSILPSLPTLRILIWSYFSVIILHS